MVNAHTSGYRRAQKIAMKTQIGTTKTFSLVLLFSVLLFLGTASAKGFSFHRPSADTPAGQWKTVIGSIGQHAVIKGETLLDVARNYELGYNEIEILYPDMDPWIPEPGTKLTIPSCWILPSTEYEGIVINVPELRLYRYVPGTNLVETYPVGIGTEEFETEP